MANLHNLRVNFACLGVCLFVCLFVCLYPINVKTAEPIGPEFCVGPHMIPAKVHGWLEFKKINENKVDTKATIQS